MTARPPASAGPDAQGGLTRHPMVPTWPRETLAESTFEAQGENTLLTLRWRPRHATEEETQTFDSSHASMQQGWTGTLGQLTAFLAT